VTVSPVDSVGVSLNFIEDERPIATRANGLAIPAFSGSSFFISMRAHARPSRYRSLTGSPSRILRSVLPQTSPCRLAIEPLRNISFSLFLRRAAGEDQDQLEAFLGAQIDRHRKLAGSHGGGNHRAAFGAPTKLADEINGVALMSPRRGFQSHRDSSALAVV
jgi:hypothetical protein